MDLENKTKSARAGVRKEMAPAVWARTCTCKCESLVRSLTSDWNFPRIRFKANLGMICKTRQNARAGGRSEVTPAAWAKTCLHLQT